MKVAKLSLILGVFMFLFVGRSASATESVYFYIPESEVDFTDVEIIHFDHFDVSYASALEVSLTGSYFFGSYGACGYGDSPFASSLYYHPSGAVTCLEWD